MKKLLLILLCLPMIGFGQNVNIPDANFKAYLVGNSLINTNGDTEIQVSEATAFSDTIECGGLNISDLTGIGAFTDLTYLFCYSNQLTSLDVSNNLALTFLDCNNNQLTSINVSGCTALTLLQCQSNQLTSLDISNNTALENLYCSNNQLTNLDVSQNTVLYVLLCSDNQLTSLDVTNNTALIALGCLSTQLTNLDVSQNTALIHLNCVDNQLTSLDVSNNTALTILDCYDNNLTSLDLRNGNNINITSFSVTNNPNLSCINVDDFQYSLINWTDIDPQHYFSNNCSGTTSIQEQTTNKELLKVTDLLGRETKGTKDEILFYIYDDGTVEKRLVIE